MSPSSTHVSAAGAIAPLFAGVDIGGTSIKLGLVDNEGRTVAYDSIPTPSDEPGEVAAERIGKGVLRLMEKSGIPTGKVLRIGVASPGPIDIPAGLIVQPGNLPNWWNFAMRDRVKHHSGLPVTFNNDANAAAYGEYWQGVGRDWHSMILLTLGTGIGGGIIVGDLLIEGAHSCGSECGHIIVDPHDDARRDTLGKSGSLEALACSYGVVGRAEDALTAGRASSLKARIAEGQSLTPLLLAEEAEKGDDLAQEIIWETARYLAIGIVTLIHTIDPEGVAIGGGMTFGGAGHPLGEKFIGHVRSEARKRMLVPLRDKVKIEFAELGGDAGYIGAAGLARQQYRQTSSG
jgi:glucokinase